MLCFLILNAHLVKCTWRFKCRCTLRTVVCSHLLDQRFSLRLYQGHFHTQVTQDFFTLHWSLLIGLVLIEDVSRVHSHIHILFLAAAEQCGFHQTTSITVDLRILSFKNLINTFNVHMTYINTLCSETTQSCHKKHLESNSVVKP